MNKNILLGITGSIAAYKSAEIVRRLRELNAIVKVVMTSSSREFITPLTMQALSGNPVHLDLMDPDAEAAMGHIELARWADLILIAPASANFIAQLAHGFANDLLSTLCLVTTAPIILAPAMNQQMWLNKNTQENIERVKKHKIKILGPADGSQACGELGPGRMLEPSEIISAIESNFIQPILKNKKIVITAGPTQEPIDPVRYISNYSSGKMGYALAEAAADASAEVILISGPTSLDIPKKIQKINVITAEEMKNAVLEHINNCDIFISAAAVADYRCVEISEHKIKKSDTEIQLHLVRNPDILTIVSQLENRPYIVGFAAETQNLIENAKIKLREKKIDLIIANKVGRPDTGFVSDNNNITAIWLGNEKNYPYASKRELAGEIIKLIAIHLGTKITCSI